MLNENHQHGFMENAGQIKDQNGKLNKQVKYLVNLPGQMNVQLKANSFSYDIYSGSPVPKSRGQAAHYQKIPTSSYLVKYHRVDISLLNANPSPEIIAENPTPSISNYFNAGMRVSARSFQKVTYRNIYSNIDLVFKIASLNHKPTIEYYFMVKPNGDIKQIQLKYNGAFKTVLNKNQIEVHVQKGVFRERIPSSFLVNDKTADLSDLIKKKNIHISYHRSGPDSYGFKASSYDRSQTLIIDPTPDLVWGTYYGGYENDIAYSIAKDAAGNIFVGGSTDNAANIATAGVYQSTMLGYSDGFLAKFNAGGKLLWTTYYGGSNYDGINSVAVDKNNDVIIAGSTFSFDNIATAGAYQTTKKGPSWGTTAFVAKFNNDGERKWGTYYGGEGVEAGYAIAVDGSNNILLTGSTTSYTGIATPGAHQTTYIGNPNPGLLVSDAFLVKFDINGNRKWGTYFGGKDEDDGYGVAVDKSDNVIITGLTYSTTAIATSGAQQTNIGSVAPQGGDGYVAKFNASGTLQWATYCGGNGGDFGWCIGADSNGNIVVGGSTTSTNNMATAGSQQTTTAANVFGDGFLAKYSGSGVKVWGTYFGGESSDVIYGLAIDAVDNIWITGLGGSNNNIATSGTYQPSKTAQGGVFIAKFTNGGQRIWGSYYGTDGYDDGQGFGIVITGENEAAITGETSATKNIASCDAVQPQWAGNQDGFVAKFTETNSPSVTISQDISNPVCKGSLVSFTAVPTNGGTSPSYQWKVNNVNAGSNNSSYSIDDLKNGDIVTCVLTSGSVCVASQTATSNSLTISVTLPVTPSVSISPSTNNICAGTPVTFTATAQNEGNSPFYQWKLNNANVGDNSPTYTGKDLINGDQVSCILTNNSACVTQATATSGNVDMIVRSIDVPSITIVSSDNNVCEGTMIAFTTHIENAGTTPHFQWLINDQKVGGDLPGYSTNNLKNGDKVECALTAAISGCNIPAISSEPLVMNLNPLPKISFSSHEKSILKGASVELQATVTGDIKSYQWTPSTGLSNSSISNPVASPLITTTYQLIVTSVNGCPATDNIKVTVLTEIKIPNTFSPNGDGINDEWNIPGLIDYPLCTVNVFNRYGQKVFNSVGYNEPWKGLFNNAPLPVGSYYYIIDLKDGKPPFSGDVTIIR